MQVSPIETIKNNLFQVYECHTENEKNIFFNSNFEDFIESPPETLGKALADVWLCLAKKHEENQLYADESETVLKNIRSVIQKIEKMDDDNKNLTQQFFIAIIACFSEEERNCLIKFLKETINSDLENSFFSFFRHLGAQLEVNTKGDVYQIGLDVFFGMKENDPEYNERLLNSFYTLPSEVQNIIYGYIKRKTEVCKDFKIKNFWENFKNTIKNTDFKFSEKEFFNSFIENPRPLNIESFQDFILCQLCDNEIYLDHLNLKDEVLNYINLTGKLPFRDLGFEKGFFFLWLGADRFQKINKLYIERSVGDHNDSLIDFHFICPNLEELQLDYISLSEEDKRKYIAKDFEDLQCLNTKTLVLPNFETDFLNLILNNVSKLKSLESLIIDFGESDRQSNIDLEKYTYENVQKNKTLSKLTIKVTKKYMLCDCEILKKIHQNMLSIFPDIVELNTTYQSDCIEIIGELKKLKKLNFLIKNNLYKDVLCNDILKLTQITDLSFPKGNLDHINHILDPNFFVPPPNLKQFNGEKISIPSQPRILAEKAARVFINEAFTIATSVPLMSTPRLTKINQWGFRAAILFSIYSWMKPKEVQAIAPSIPNSMPLPISSSFGKISMIAAGAFLTLGLGAIAYYYRTQNQKSKVNANSVKPKMDIIKN